MTFKNKYQSSIDKMLFSADNPDNLFKNDVKPYIKDQKRFQRAITMLRDPKGKDIYELGPYPGTGIYYFGEKNRIFGVGKSNLEFLEKFGSTGHEFIDVDFELFNNKKMKGADIVLVMEVLEHIRMSYQFLKRVTTMVKPGGLIYLTTNNKFYIGYILKLLLNKEILDPIETEGTFYPGHCRYYDANELKGVFEKLGFKIIESNYINFLPGYRLYKNEKFGAIKNIFLKMLPQRFSTHIEILVQRPE